MKNMELHDEEHEKIIAKLEQDYKILLFVSSTSVIRELQFVISKNELLEQSLVPELKKLNHDLIQETNEYYAYNT